MKQALLMLGALATLAPQAKVGEVERTRFLNFAMFEGLMEEGVETSLLTPLLAHEETYFVMKCPICWPVRDGIKTYLKAREHMSYPAIGGGFPEEIKTGLRSADKKAQHKALEAMIDRYVSRRYEKTVMTADEKAQMKSSLAEGKKRGMTLKQQSFGDACPSCEGATKK